jgi:hypothetical protein
LGRGLLFAWWIGAGLLQKKRVNLSTHPSSLYINAFTYIGNKYFYIQVVSKTLIDLFISSKLSIFAV